MMERRSFLMGAPAALIAAPLATQAKAVVPTMEERVAALRAALHAALEEQSGTVWVDNSSEAAAVVCFIDFGTPREAAS